MANWHYELLGEKIGPIPSSELLEKVRSGEVKPDTPLRKDNSQWVLAKDVSGLFEQAGMRHRCPNCHHLIPPPPVRCDNCMQEVAESSVVQMRAGEKPKEKKKPNKPLMSADEVKATLTDRARSWFRRSQ